MLKLVSGAVLIYLLTVYPNLSLRQLLLGLCMKYADRVKRFGYCSTKLQNWWDV